MVVPGHVHLERGEPQFRKDFGPQHRVGLHLLFVPFLEFGFLFQQVPGQLRFAHIVQQSAHGNGSQPSAHFIAHHVAGGNHIMSHVHRMAVGELVLMGQKADYVARVGVRLDQLGQLRPQIHRPLQVLFAHFF